MTNALKTILMHELGHTFTILKRLNAQEYFGRGESKSVMNLLTMDNVRNSPYYSTEDLSINRWWILRGGFDTIWPAKHNSEIDK